MNEELTRPRGEGLPSSAHILNAIRSDLAAVVAPDVQSERSRVLLQMMDGLLRQLIVREQIGGADLAILVDAQSVDAQDADTQDAGAQSAASPRQRVAAEDAALAAMTLAEERVPTLRLAPEVEARFAVTPERLTAYLREQVDGMADATVVAVRQVVGGLSKETFLFDAVRGDGQATGLVLRRDIPNPPIQSSAADEVQVLAPLFALGLPVPEPLHGQRDPAHFGMPFQICRKVGGKAISGAVEMNDLGAEAQVNGQQLAIFLAQLHSVDIAQIPHLAQPGWSSSDYVRHHVGHWRDWWLENRMEPSAILETAFGWLLDNVPEAPRPTLVHGDAGLHNIMIEDGRTTAMIDWELVHVGDPSEDLLYSRNWIEQVMDFDAFLTIYRDHGGAEIDPRTARYYSLLNSVRNVTCTIAQYRGYRDAVLPLLPSAYAGVKWGKVFLRKAAEDLSVLLP